MRTVFSVLTVLVFTATLAQTCEDGFRPFEHFGGMTCIPENPERIVTTQDQNGLLPLLELGIKPVGSAGLALEEGYRFRRVEGYETEGIGFIGAYWGEANLESITSLSPDLIVSHEFAEQFYNLHSEIAPTVMVQIFDRPLTKVLMDFAAIVGREDRAKVLLADYEARVKTFLEKLGERKESLSIAVISPDSEGVFYRGDSGQAVGTVMDSVDLLRPEPQASRDNDSREYQSLESLKAHDADVMFVLQFGADGEDDLVNTFINSPVFQSLEVAKAGQVYIIDGLATVGAAWGKMNAYIDELERILLDPDLRTDVIIEQ